MSDFTEPYDNLYNDIKYGHLDGGLYTLRELIQERIEIKERNEPFEDLHKALQQIEEAQNYDMVRRATLGTRLFSEMKKHVEGEDLAVRGFAKGVQAEIAVKLLGIDRKQVESFADGVGGKRPGRVLAIIDNSGSVDTSLHDQMDVHIQMLADEGATLMVLDGHNLTPVSASRWRDIGRGGCWPEAAAKWLDSLEPKLFTRVIFIHDGRGVDDIPESWTQVVVGASDTAEV